MAPAISDDGIDVDHRNSISIINQNVRKATGRK